MSAARRPARIESFDFRPGRKIGRRYQVVAPLGRGTEGEVYQIQEIDTAIQRAVKIYFPHRDPNQKSIIWYARKLNTLRHCPIVLQYHHTEQITVAKRSVRCLISELCEGVPLERWVARHRGGRLRPYMALCVVYHLARGLEAIHALGEYHADVHTQNIIIRPRGVRFTLKLVDFYDWGRPAAHKQKQDIVDTVRVLYECLGGCARYAAMPPPIKHIVAGMQRKLILKRFVTITALRRHLETFDWPSMLD